MNGRVTQMGTQRRGRPGEAFPTSRHPPRIIWWERAPSGSPGMLRDGRFPSLQHPGTLWPIRICLIGQGAPLVVVGDSCYLVDSILYLSRSTQYHSSCICMTLNSTYYLSFLLFTFNFSLFTSCTYLWFFCTYFTTYFDRMTLAYYIFTYCPLMPLILAFFAFFHLFLLFFEK